MIIVGLGAVFILAFSQASINNDPSPCQEPLTYRIAFIDPRFDIDRKALRKTMQKVEALWKTALNKNVLRYRPNNGEVDIHLIHAKGQSNTKTEQQFLWSIKKIEQQIVIGEKYLETLKKSHQKKQDAYQKSVTSYNSAVEIYNTLVKNWNKKGLTTFTEEEVDKMQQNLQKLKSKITHRKDSAQISKTWLNSQLNRIQNLKQNRSSLIVKYNEHYNISKTFNRGQFVSQKDDPRIDIYKYRNLAELKMILAHEIGHALGLQHVDNPKSIMYTMMGEQDISDLTLTQEDKQALQKKCNQ